MKCMDGKAIISDFEAVTGFESRGHISLPGLTWVLFLFLPFRVSQPSLTWEERVPCLP